MIKLDVSWFEKINEIMQEAFPIVERRDVLGQRALFQLPYYQVYGLTDEQTLLAFLAVWEFDELIFGEHLASLSQKRGTGIGRELLEQYMQSIQKPVFFEVEKPETDIAKRRIAFYERLGFVLYDHIPYAQPSFHKGEPLPLYLMSNQLGLDDNTVKHYINIVYRKVYGEEEPWS